MDGYALVEAREDASSEPIIAIRAEDNINLLFDHGIGRVHGLISITDASADRAQFVSLDFSEELGLS